MNACRSIACHAYPWMKSEPASYNFRMSVLRAVPLAFIVTMLATAQQTISFPTEDGGQVCGDLYGQGDRAVVLAHGGRFNKESWHEQEQALATKGFRILAIDFRGFGCSTGPGQADFFSAPFPNDVLAAVGYLKSHGAKTVSVVGGSFGCAAAGDASIRCVVYPPRTDCKNVPQSPQRTCTDSI